MKALGDSGFFAAGLSTVALSLSLAGLVACGGDAPAAFDGAVDAPDSAIERVALPEPPALPSLTPCPDGFREVSIAPDVSVCDPAPAGGVPSCPNGQGWFPGEADCSDVGAPCPAGDFADGLPSSGVVYVQPDAAPGGDGSRTAPYQTLADFSVGLGATVALSKGDHVGVLLLPRGASVVGACAAETSVSSPVPLNTEGVFTTRAPSTVIRDLTIARSERPAIVALGDGASISVEGVIIVEPRMVGVLTIRADVDLHNVLIRDVRLAAGFNRALSFERGASVSIERVAISGGGSSDGLYLIGEGTTATVSNLYVHDVAKRGIAVETGATASFDRVLVERFEIYGLLVGEESASASFSNGVVRQAVGVGVGRCMGAEDARLSVARSWLDGGGEAGAVAIGPEATLTMRDSFVHSTMGGADGLKGVGIMVADGARLELERVVVEDARMVGIGAESGEPSTSLIDVTVRDVGVEMGTNSFGMGVYLERGHHLVHRVSIEDVVDTGLMLESGGTEVEFEDLAVRRVVSNPSTGNRGVGISVQHGGVLDGDRMLIEDVREMGIASLVDSQVNVGDATIRRVLRPPCAADGTPCLLPLALGVVSADATTIMSRFLVSDAGDCGLFIIDDGALDASEGTVHGSGTGACVQVPGYDLDRISASVEYQENGTNLDSTHLPVPTPPAEFPGL